MKLTLEQLDTTLAALIYASNYVMGLMVNSDRETRLKYGNELHEIEGLIDIFEEQRNKQ